MKIGLLLGTFDPPHIGHIYLAIKALESKEVDRVWLVPAWNSPWKPNATEYSIRLEMCKVILEDYPDIRVSNVDGNIKSQYTYEFLTALLTLYPDDSFVIISGSDIDFDKWKKGNWIKETFNNFVVSRNNLVCSSTKIREMITNGEDPRPLVTPNVYKIIIDKNLYDK